MPKRLQRRRTAGGKMPEGAIYVGRGTPYGNPFRVGGNFAVGVMAMSWSESFVKGPRYTLIETKAMAVEW